MAAAAAAAALAAALAAAVPAAAFALTFVSSCIAMRMSTFGVVLCARCEDRVIIVAAGVGCAAGWAPEDAPLLTGVGVQFAAAESLVLSGLSLVCILHAAGKSELDAPVEASIVRGGGAGIRPPLEAGDGPSDTAAAPFPVVALLSTLHRGATGSDSASGLVAASSAGEESCTNALMKMAQRGRTVYIGEYTRQLASCIGTWLTGTGCSALICTSLESVKCGTCREEPRNTRFPPTASASLGFHL